MEFSSYYILKNRVPFAISFGTILTTCLIVLLISLEDIVVPQIQPDSIKITFQIESSPKIDAAKKEVVPPPSPKEVIKKEVKPKTREVESLPTKSETVIPKEVEPPRDVDNSQDVIETIAIDKSSQIEVEETVAEPIGEEAAEELTEDKYTEIKSLKGASTTPDPRYPKSAIKWKLEGIVELEFIINKKGDIVKVDLIKSSGHTILDKECIKTIKSRWKFSPQDGSKTIFKRFIFNLE